MYAAACGEQAVVAAHGRCDAPARARVLVCPRVPVFDLCPRGLRDVILTMHSIG